MEERWCEEGRVKRLRRKEDSRSKTRSLRT